MLTNLDIKSLKLVDHISLEIREGMNVITGETGAGKSILLGALGLALGERADASLIQTNEEKTEISARFELEQQPTALKWLQNKALDDGTLCILRRIIPKQGSSKAFINGSPTTLSELKTFSQMLLDVHSQHEHQLLLKKNHQLKLIDKFGDLENLLAKTSENFKKMREIEIALEEFLTNQETHQANEQLLRYQLEELAKLDIQEGETESLESTYKELETASKNKEKIKEAIAILSGEQDRNLGSLLNKSIKDLESVDSERLLQSKEMLKSAYIQIEEASSDLSLFLDNFDTNIGRLEEIEDRLGKIYEISRKHKVQPEELVELSDSLEKAVLKIDSLETGYQELSNSLETAKTTFFANSKLLSTARVKAGHRLEKKVTQSLRSLGMEGAIFKVNITQEKNVSAHGTDDLEFLISTLPKEEPKPLHKIASGGELSRISLAIQVATTSGKDTPTIVFDEIDAGIGGPTAEVVGNLLQQLGLRTQVICVTHLAQVAAKGETQYLVSKDFRNGDLYTSVTELDEENRIKEISRMIGGIEETAQSLLHAKAILNKSKP
ncbi:MAG: DNA repair protein RecN [Gammaproteobacteria bacterium]|nr:DNA repair protein RecN [Gammaproteobacteria bacterium]